MILICRIKGGWSIIVTIKDVAKKANVSVATVSYVINNNPKVKEETRGKVLEVIKELGYKPNFAGRMLKTKEAKIVGAYVSDLRGYFYGEVLSGLKDSIIKNGYEFVIVTGSLNHRLMNENVLDGVIILDSHFSTRELLNYADSGLKIVLMDRLIEHKNIDCITLNNAKGINLGMDYLSGLGYREVSCLTGPENSFDSMARLSAALNYAKLNNISLNVTAGNFDYESGYDFAKRQHLKYSTKKAVFSFNDEMVVGMYHYFKDIGEDICNYFDLSSFDNINLMQYLGIPMSTIDYSKYGWGYEAGSLLINSLNHKLTTEYKTFDVGIIRY